MDPAFRSFKARGADWKGVMNGGVIEFINVGVLLFVTVGHGVLLGSIVEVHVGVIVGVSIGVRVEIDGVEAAAGGRLNGV
jgi:hypothetical protein